MEYEPIFEKLGYYFRNTDLLSRALRHRSLGKESNERLEFLGDSILNFIIADELFYRYPEMKEGELSRLRANLVNGETLAELAQDLELDTHIQVGHGALLHGHYKSKSILADAMEAIIGAIYLDSGFTVAQRHVLVWFASRLSETAGIVKKDPKTLLQEWLQMKKAPLPTYTIKEMVGAAHAKTFTVTCDVGNLAETTVGTGNNKRTAEREAAQKMLLNLDLNLEENPL